MAPLLWWRPTAATFVVAINRVDVVHLVVDLDDVDLDVDFVDVDLDVALCCGCCPVGSLDLEKSCFGVLFDFLQVTKLLLFAGI